MAGDLAEGQKMILELLALHPEVGMHFQQPHAWEAQRPATYCSCVSTTGVHTSLNSGCQGLLETAILDRFSTGKGQAFGVQVINKLMNSHRLISKVRADGARMYAAVEESQAAK